MKTPDLRFIDSVIELNGIRHTVEMEDHANNLYVIADVSAEGIFKHSHGDHYTPESYDLTDVILMVWKVSAFGLIDDECVTVGGEYWRELGRSLRDVLIRRYL